MSDYKEYFNDLLCEKLNIINMHMNVLMMKYFPDLCVQWKNYDISSEIVFSSYLISLFTSFLTPQNDFLFDFWDIILLVFSKGKVIGNCEVYFVHN